VLERDDRPPELVLADIAMPGINGVEFAAIVHRTWPALPVVLMTGYADDDLLRQGANHAVLRKPFGAAELTETVEQALARSRDGGA
jgi:CheY-like chemotaxis protein